MIDKFLILFADFLWKLEYTVLLHEQVPWMEWTFCWNLANKNDTDLSPEEAVTKYLESNENE